jgi:GT2 family glycosyltransferase
MIVYRNSAEQLEKALNALIICIREMSSKVEIVIGSNSVNQNLNRAYLNIVNKYTKQIDIKLHISPHNIGHGALHNVLFFEFDHEYEYLLIINPDGLIGPNSLSTMMEIMKKKDVGAVEARQLPFDHPKIFNKDDGTTSWVSGCCTLVRSEIFRKVYGFDKRFFMHCDDIDLSWRIRNEGFKLVYSVNSIFFHDKHIGRNGYPELSKSEEFYGPLGALLLAHKYGLKRGLKSMIGALSVSNMTLHREVLKAYEISINLHSPVKIRRTIPKYIDSWKFEQTRY